MSRYEPIAPERKEIIDKFLKMIATIAFENNFDMQKLENITYAQLQGLGVQNFTRESHTELFSKWISDYQGNAKMDVYVQENWKYFCQFLSKDRLGREIKETDYVKMYIPLDKEHLELGVKKIFDFCCENDIKHVSKVSDIIRSDDVVVRTLTLEDANKVLNFVKNDSYIQDSKLKPNPFCIQKGKIGFAMDNSHSYNNIVSELIAKYTLRKRINSDFNISYENFSDFVNLYINQERIPTKKKEIMKLINVALKTDDLIAIMDHFENVSINKTLKMSDEECITTLNECLKTTKEKYDETQEYNALLYYLRDDDPSCFSRYSKNDVERKNNHRCTMEKLDRDRIEKILRHYYKMENDTFDYKAISNAHCNNLNGTNLYFDTKKDTSFHR